MHRTTVRIDEHLLAQAKEYGSRHRRSLTAVIEDALRALLARTPAQSTARSRQGGFRLPVSKEKGGPLPGVNLNSHAELLEKMEEGLPLDKRR